MSTDQPPRAGSAPAARPAVPAHPHDVPGAEGRPPLNAPGLRRPSEEKIQGRGLVAVDGALALIAILLIVQMWLLTAALESDLAGHHEVTWPAAAISAVLFAMCAGLYAFVEALDRDLRGRP